MMLSICSGVTTHMIAQKTSYDLHDVALIQITSILSAGVFLLIPQELLNGGRNVGCISDACIRLPSC